MLETVEEVGSVWGGLAAGDVKAGLMGGNLGVSAVVTGNNRLGSGGMGGNDANQGYGG